RLQPAVAAFLEPNVYKRAAGKAEDTIFAGHYLCESVSQHQHVGPGLSESGDHVPRMELQECAHRGVEPHAGTAIWKKLDGAGFLRRPRRAKPPIQRRSHQRPRSSNTQ